MVFYLLWTLWATLNQFGILPLVNSWQLWQCSDFHAKAKFKNALKVQNLKPIFTQLSIFSLDVNNITSPYCFFSAFSNFQMIDQENMQILSALKPHSIIGIDFVILTTLKSSSQEFLHYSQKTKTNIYSSIIKVRN